MSDYLGGYILRAMRTHRAKKEKASTSERRENSFDRPGGGASASIEGQELGHQQHFIHASTRSQNDRGEERAKSVTARKGIGENKRYNFVLESAEQERRAGRDDAFYEEFNTYFNKALSQMDDTEK